MNKFDVIVIGTGTAGQTAAFDLATDGLRVGIIEKSDMPGGVCALRGCQAKKWFYEVTELVARCRHLQDIGVAVPPLVDWRQILQEKNKFTSGIPANTVNNIKGHGIEFIPGKATFIDQGTISVNDALFSASAFIVATGARPRDLPIKGHEHTITSDDFLELPSLPRRIAFIGGGFISFELSHFAARLGSESGSIHILEAGERVLSAFDKEMVQQLVEASAADGIQVHTNVSVVSVQKNDSDYSIAFESGDDLTVDLVVNAAGRVPNIESLNLQDANVAFSPKGITVDKNMRTSNDNIYAVGDCVEAVQLARVADMEAHVAARTIISAKEGVTVSGIDYTTVPTVLFTYPQLGKLGQTEEQLKEKEATYWKSDEKNLGWPTYRRVGLKHAAYKILVDENDLILGVHLLSDNTTGLLNTFKHAMLSKTPVHELYEDSILTPYPSRESDILYMLSPFVE